MKERETERGEGDKGEKMEGFECRKGSEGGRVALATGWTYEKEGWECRGLEWI